MAAFDTQAIFSQIMGMATYVIAILFVIVVCYGIFWIVRREMRYPYKVIIIDKSQTGGVIYKGDRGGVFIDKKTNNKLFFLKKHKASLSPDNIPFVFFNGKKCVFVIEAGHMNFRFVEPNIQVRQVVKEQFRYADDGSVMKDENGNQLVQQVVIEEDIFSLRVGEEDVNWAINAYDRSKVLFMKTTFMQLLPYLTLAFVALCICVIFIYFFKHLDALVEMSQNFKLAATELAKGQAGTVVVAGG